jgi:hypothetical protein
MTRKYCRSLATGLALAAVAAPAAQAAPITEPGSGYAGPVETTEAAPAVTTTIDEGFDWGSAAIGAGGSAALILLSLGGAVQVSRVRARVHGA